MRLLSVVLLFNLFGAILEGANPPELVIPKIDVRLKLEDFLDMRPRAGLDGKLAKVDGFVQSNPTDGAPPSQKTVVYMAYDEYNLYVVFVCFDSDPHKITAVMTKRENITDDEDWVEVFLDTFNDQRQAYDFSTNALGVQWDSRYSEATGHQPSFDALWYSDGRLTNQGYVVWMAIPFKSMRFPDASSQKWRTVFGRSIPRNNEYCAWPHVSKQIQGTLSQSSLLTGLENISPGKNIQFIPYTSLRSFRLLETDIVPPGFITEKTDASGGVDGKFILKDSFVFDLTLNPDFSQVESDAPQVTVNQRFEVFFPEKRPFFLENAQYFETPMNLVFTRRIADPQFGGRLTSKYGPYTLAFLFANDEAPGKRVSGGSSLFGKDAYFGIARVTRDIFAQSSIGMIFTNRTFEGITNRVFGADFTLRINDQWQAVGQAVRSWSDTAETSSFTGWGFSGSLKRTGRQFAYELTYNDLSPDFQTLTGFIPRTDYRIVTNFARYYFRPEGKILVAWGPEFTLSKSWDNNGTRLDSSVHPSFYVELQRRTFITVHYFRDRERIRPSDFSGLTESVDFATPLLTLNINTSFWRAGTFVLHFERGKSINFVPATEQTPSRADFSAFNASFLYRPIQKLQLRYNYFFTALDAPLGPTIFNDHIVRSYANYQFTKNLSLRLILQYESTIPNPQFTSLENRRNLNADFLITYLVNPWTALYIGYNGNRQNLQLAEDETGIHVVRTRGFLMNDANQFFLKFSYLLRF